LQQSRSVSASDEEMLLTAEERTHATPLDSARVALGVDHEHASRSYCDMVDVRSRSRQPSVVQNDGTIAEIAIEAPRHALLTCGALRPRPGGLGFLGQREEHAAKSRMLAPDLVSPSIATPGVLASCRCACSASGTAHLCFVLNLELLEPRVVVRTAGALHGSNVGIPKRGRSRNQ
jgi:hypothetical protein